MKTLDKFIENQIKLLDLHFSDEHSKQVIVTAMRETARATIESVRIEAENLFNHHERFHKDCQHCIEVLATNAAIIYFDQKSKSWLGEK